MDKEGCITLKTRLCKHFIEAAKVRGKSPAGFVSSIPVTPVSSP